MTVRSRRARNARELLTITMAGTTAGFVLVAGALLMIQHLS
jgi:hypothetical protein